ncbi:MAG: DUF2235 domain-containing protein [Gammaproteobacteria bacterium]|nr:DUF2235 domain-containing protein [Gammaproteobacteria bacterium]
MMTKNIVLCSDGTGNKGGYGEDTNIYKLYKSIDLHHPQQPQITCYDNGIAAQENQNKYFRVLARAFGFGFKANICDLYEFLARNYDPGDAIYLFGFSRGGATVRALAGMLYACGLVNRYDDQGLEKSSNVLRADIAQAMNAYQGIGKDQRQAANDFKVTKALHDNQYLPNGVLPIQFIGVWETVSALGFPKDWSITFDWFFSWLDCVTDPIWPHRFYDYELNETMHYACQALSIDDERKTFDPMVWNESANRFSGVVEQVWFSGVHSNVGGGYARTGLSDFSMDWMLRRAIDQGLVLKPGVQAWFEANADVYDRLYDSREGIAVYYRYQPRDIARLCSEINGNVKIHNSVLQRIRQNVAGYAPGFLPYEFDVVDTPLHEPLTSVQSAQNKDEWKACRDQIDNYVDQLQWMYRIFVEFTLLVILVSGWLWTNADGAPIPAEPSNAFQAVFGHIADVFQYILPAYFEHFIHYVIRVHSWLFVGIVIAIMVMLRWRKRLKSKLRQTREQLRLLLLQNTR